MPAFCARWPDGSFSIVDADDKTHALIQLDELGDEPAQLWQMDSCLLDFELTDHGTFRLKQFGEETGPEILETAYPVLNKALGAKAFSEHSIEEQREPVEYAPRANTALRKAVETERERLKDSMARRHEPKVVRPFSVRLVDREFTSTPSLSTWRQSG